MGRTSAAGSEAPARTADGRYIVIGGRRWRATDPSVPEKLQAELRSALMSARRRVGADLRNGVDARASRAAVHDAKLALGERGRPWWEPQDDAAERLRIAAAMRTLIAARAPGTACPSDIARIVGGEAWRSLMPAVRDVAVRLAIDGDVVVTQHGKPVEAPWRGPVRLRLAAGDDDVQEC